MTDLCRRAFVAYIFINFLSTATKEMSHFVLIFIRGDAILHNVSKQKLLCIHLCVAHLSYWYGSTV